MTRKTIRICLCSRVPAASASLSFAACLAMAGCTLLAAFAPSTSGAEPQERLPTWFDGNRVQAHFENAIQQDLSGLYRELHPAIRSMGAHVLTRIFKTTGEGAWWPTAAGYTNGLLGGRDLAMDIARDAHQHGLKTIAYYRIMCDDFVEKEHPEWLCRDLAGKLVLEPRTRKRPNPQDRKHVICFNSPAAALVQTRLVELADRGVDAIYFDSWHMPEVCACDNCKALYRKETGREMRSTAERGSEEYLHMTEFVARSIVRNFQTWKKAVNAKHPKVIFAISSSLYPCFDSQMQITASLLEISDTSKTEFSKPFGGFLGDPPTGNGIEAKSRRRPFMDATFDIPSYDLQNALGWSITRDSCDGRPPLMWIPFTRTEEEAIFSTAAAISYGCIASIHPTGLLAPRSTSIKTSATEIYKSSYALGEKVSPWLAKTRPLPFTLIHVSERSRNARIGDPRALWLEFFAPVLGAFETLKEEHLPVATINDLQFEHGIPSQTRLLILPHQRETTDKQQSVIRAFEAAGGTVVRLDADKGWHLTSEKPRLKRELLEQIEARIGPPPIRARGPAAMHAVFFAAPGSPRQVACLVNSFGWFRAERGDLGAQNARKAPPPCADVMLEIPAGQPNVRRAFDAATGQDMAVRRQGGKTIVLVPEFPVMACVVVEQVAPGKPEQPQ